MFELKKLPPEAVASAIALADRYRLLNEPREAESICRDVLAVEPENQEAMTMLILALTDRFQADLAPAFNEARELVKRLPDGYCQAYYEGIICERRAKAHLDREVPGAGSVAYEWFRRAMDAYEKAMLCSPAEKADSLLRWNTCARVIMTNPSVTEPIDDSGVQMLE